MRSLIPPDPTKANVRVAPPAATSLDLFNMPPPRNMTEPRMCVADTAWKCPGCHGCRVRSIRLIDWGVNTIGNTIGKRTVAAARRTRRIKAILAATIAADVAVDFATRKQRRSDSIVAAAAAAAAAAATMSEFAAHVDSIAPPLSPRSAVSAVSAFNLERRGRCRRRRHRRTHSHCRHPYTATAAATTAAAKSPTSAPISATIAATAIAATLPAAAIAAPRTSTALLPNKVHEHLHRLPNGYRRNGTEAPPRPCQYSENFTLNID